MEAIRILEKPTTITWDYDEDADVLYPDFSVSLSGVPSRQGNPYEDYESV